jgi:chromate reductase, NAD(P)H dehydrogenase (quinone)
MRRLPDPVRILLISGSTRSGSTNSAALRTAHAASVEGVETELYDRLAGLPVFNPDDDFDPLPPAVIELRERISAADGVLFCTPEYAGALPGSFKNLLDWTVGGPEMYEKPVAWVNVATEGRGGHADASLRTVLGYLHSEIVEPAQRRITVPRDAVGEDGLVVAANISSDLEQVLRAFADHVRGEATPS